MRVSILGGESAVHTRLSSIENTFFIRAVHILMVFDIIRVFDSELIINKYIIPPY